MSIASDRTPAPATPDAPPKLSVAIVCKNNQTTIARVLDACDDLRTALRERGLAMEIVAADSGSTDNTIPLLVQHQARVLNVQWRGHIATKQLVLEACAGEWIIHLDSDEAPEPDAVRALAGFVADPGTARAAMINRKVWYLGRWLNHVWQPEWRLRVVRRDDVHAGLARWGGVNPHDKMELVGQAAGATVARLAGDVRHESFADIADHLAKQVALARVSAHSLHDAGVAGSRRRLLISPPGAFFKQLILRQGWRDGWRGWAASASAAIATAMKHAMLLELSGRRDNT